MKSFLMNLLLTIANTADNLASKLATNEPEPLLDYEKRGYEPAEIIHNGEFHINSGGTYYEAYNQPDGSTEIWANGEHIGFYPKDQALLEIIDHAKGQERT